MKRKTPFLAAVLILLSVTGAHAISSKALSELLQNEFARRNAFVMIERMKLDQALAEQQLELSGLVENEATKLGRLVGADEIVTGSIMKVNDQFAILVKVVDVATGVVRISEGVKVNDESKLERAVRSVVTKIVKEAKAQWGASLPEMKFAVVELADLRDPQPTAAYQHYIVTVTPAVQSLPTSFKADMLLSVDALSLASGGIVLNYEGRFNHFGMSLLLDLSFPDQGTVFFSYGFNYKIYPFKINDIIHPYIGIGFMMSFEPLSIPLMGSVGIRLHPIPGFDKVFIEGCGGILYNFMPFIQDSASAETGTLYRFFVSVYAGWKF